MKHRCRSPLSLFAAIMRCLNTKTLPANTIRAGKWTTRYRRLYTPSEGELLCTTEDGRSRGDQPLPPDQVRRGSDGIPVQALPSTASQAYPAASLVYFPIPSRTSADLCSFLLTALVFATLFPRLIFLTLPRLLIPVRCVIPCMLCFLISRPSCRSLLALFSDLPSIVKHFTSLAS
jgi:hypothetical protein